MTKMSLPKTQVQKMLASNPNPQPPNTLISGSSYIGVLSVAFRPDTYMIDRQNWHISLKLAMHHFTPQMINARLWDCGCHVFKTTKLIFYDLDIASVLKHLHAIKLCFHIQLVYYNETAATAVILHYYSLGLRFYCQLSVICEEFTLFTQQTSTESVNVTHLIVARTQPE